MVRFAMGPSLVALGISIGRQVTFETAGSPSLVNRFMTDWQDLSVFSSVEPGERAYA
jgi:hypothetical protein